MTLDIHSLIGPYALDAVDGDERDLFEAHLDECDECRSELSGFMETAARLGDLPAQHPSDEFTARLMSAVAATPQERPIVTALAGRSRVRATVPRMIAAAATVVALAGIGAFAVEHDRNSDLRAEKASMTQILTAADAERSTSGLRDGGSLQMIKSTSAGGVVLIASDLPQLTKKSYQLWTMTDGKARSQGLLSATSTVKLIGDTGDADTVAITIEPEGGSTSPSTAPIAAMPI